MPQRAAGAAGRSRGAQSEIPYTNMRYSPLGGHCEKGAVYVCPASQAVSSITRDSR